MSGCFLREGPRLVRANAGAVAAAWSRAGGGAVALSHGGMRAELDVRLRGTLRGQPVELRQSHDPSPELLPLEEGDARVGVRSLWSFLGPDDEILGEGFQDAWLSRHGEVFLSVALRLARDALTVEHAALDIALEGVDEVDCRADALLATAGETGLLCTWPSGLRRSDSLLWRGPRPPFYERWPPLFDQWSLDPATSGWMRFAGGGPFVDEVAAGRGRIGLAWIDGQSVEAVPQLDLRGLLFLGLGRPARLEQLAHAHAHPLAPTVHRGRLRAYEELDGAYEVAADGDACEIVFPPDAAHRPLRVRVFGLDAAAGFATSGGAELSLLSERGRTDDPLVWVDVPAHGRADEALLAVDASADRPTRVALRRQEGLHVAYQRRDARRRLTVHHPADRDRPVAIVELASLHLRDIRLPGHEWPALHDVPLFWMRYLPKASAHVADRLSEVQLLEQSADAVALRIAATTPDGMVRSQYTLELPYRANEVALRIRAELSGAASWALPTFEYADLFPEAGIDPAHWDYRQLALVRNDEVRIVEQTEPYPGLAEVVAFPQPVLDAMTVAHALPGCGPFSFGATGAVVLAGSKRGTIVAIVRNPRPHELEHFATLCEHWADVHLDAAAIGGRPVASETAARHGNDAPQVPDEIEAELTLRILDPARVSFDDALELAREACAAPAAVGR